MAPKKASATSSHNFAIGDVVLGRIKGYPDWPAKIVDPEKLHLRKEVRNQKHPAGAHLIRFYPDADYAWQTNSDLKPLPTETITKFIANNDKGKRDTALLKAYKTAQDPAKWEEDQAAEMERMRNAPEQEDELDDEDAKTGSKRKAPAKGKATTAKKAKTTTAARPKNTTTRSAQETKSKPKKNDDISEGEKKCKDWRHKLQRGFLSGSVPKDEEMPAFDAILKEMEDFEHKEEWLSATKLPKVVRRIGALNNIPREAEFNIKARCQSLLETFKTFLPEGKDDDNAPLTAAAEKKPEDNVAAEDEKPKDAPAPAVEDGDLTAMDQTMDQTMDDATAANLGEEKGPQEAANAAGEDGKVNGDA